MTTKEITKSIYDANKVYNIYTKFYDCAGCDSYMILNNNNPVIYVKDGNSYFMHECDKDYNSIINDDEFAESMILYYIEDLHEEHITEILHWYADKNKSINNAPFSLLDILECGYNL